MHFKLYLKWIGLCFLLSIITIKVKMCCSTILPNNDYDTSKLNSNSAFLIVSTLDGFIHALDLNDEGKEVWKLDVGGQPLISSSLGKAEAVRNGVKIRVIPSLDGKLYQYEERLTPSAATKTRPFSHQDNHYYYSGDGKFIHRNVGGDDNDHEVDEEDEDALITALPFTTSSLLETSLRFSEDITLVGGEYATTYGIDVTTGKLNYKCGLDGCQTSFPPSKTPPTTTTCPSSITYAKPAIMDGEHEDSMDNDFSPNIDKTLHVQPGRKYSNFPNDKRNPAEDVLMVKRIDRIVRSVDSRLGFEKWNFSVGDIDINYVKGPSVKGTKEGRRRFGYQYLSSNRNVKSLKSIPEVNGLSGHTESPDSPDSENNDKTVDNLTGYELSSDLKSNSDAFNKHDDFDAEGNTTDNDTLLSLYDYGLTVHVPEGVITGFKPFIVNHDYHSLNNQNPKLYSIHGGTDEDETYTKADDFLTLTSSEQTIVKNFTRDREWHKSFTCPIAKVWSFLNGQIQLLNLHDGEYVGALKLSQSSLPKGTPIYIGTYKGQIYVQSPPPPPPDSTKTTSLSPSSRDLISPSKRWPSAVTAGSQFSPPPVIRNNHRDEPYSGMTVALRGGTNRNLFGKNTPPFSPDMLAASGKKKKKKLRSPNTNVLYWKPYLATSLTRTPLKYYESSPSQINDRKSKNSSPLKSEEFFRPVLPPPPPSIEGSAPYEIYEENMDNRRPLLNNVTDDDPAPGIEKENTQPIRSTLESTKLLGDETGTSMAPLTAFRSYMDYPVDSGFYLWPEYKGEKNKDENTLKEYGNQKEDDDDLENVKDENGVCFFLPKQDIFHLPSYPAQINRRQKNSQYCFPKKTKLKAIKDTNVYDVRDKDTRLKNIMTEHENEEEHETTTPLYSLRRSYISIWIYWKEIIFISVCLTIVIHLFLFSGSLEYLLQRYVPQLLCLAVHTFLFNNLTYTTHARASTQKSSSLLTPADNSTPEAADGHGGDGTTSSGYSTGFTPICRDPLNTVEDDDPKVLNNDVGINTSEHGIPSTNNNNSSRKKGKPHTISSENAYKENGDNGGHLLKEHLTRSATLIPLNNMSAQQLQHQPPLLSRFLNDFQTVHCLGRGGFGLVLQVKNKMDDQFYAIKRIVLPDNEHSKEKVLREVKALAKLDHVNIVRYFQAWIEPDFTGFHDNLPKSRPEHNGNPSFITDQQTQHINVQRNKSDSEMAALGIHNSISVPSHLLSLSGTSEDITSLSSYSADTPYSYNLFLNSSTGDHRKNSPFETIPTPTADDEDIGEEFVEFEAQEESSENASSKNLITIPSSRFDKRAEANECEPADALKSAGATAISAVVSGPNEKDRQRHRHRSSVQATRTKGKLFLYIQMQLCQRQTLKEWLLLRSAQHPPLPSNLQNHQKPRPYVHLPRQIKSSGVFIFDQIVEAVQYFHEHGLIHRDLKPSNIFFSMEGVVKIGDFGLAVSGDDAAPAPSSTVDHQRERLHEATSTARKQYTLRVGTRLYMSPEQVENKIYTNKIDIYSLGLILFELLVPFSTQMERVKTMTQCRDGIYPHDFEIIFPQESKIVKWLLSKNPKDRPSAKELKCNEDYVSLLKCCATTDSNND